MRNRTIAAIIAALCLACIVCIAPACAPTSSDTGKPGSEQQQPDVITDEDVPLTGGVEEPEQGDTGEGTEQQAPSGEETPGGTGTEPAPAEPTEPAGTDESAPAEQETATDETAQSVDVPDVTDEEASVGDEPSDDDLDDTTEVDPDELADSDVDLDELTEEELAAKAEAEAEEAARLQAEAEAERKAAEEAAAKARAEAEAIAKAKEQAAYDVNKRVYAAPIKSGIYIIRLYCATSKVLDAAGGGTKNGTNVQLYSSNNSDAQAWYFKVDARGLYTIINMKSNLALHAAGAGKNNGTNIILYQQNGSNAQKFIIQKSGNGYEIIPIYSKAYGVNDLAVDVKGGKTANKTNIQLYADNNGKSQRFTFSNVTSRYNNPTKAVQVITSAARACKTQVNVERFCFSYDTLQKAYKLWQSGTSPMRYQDSFTQNVKLVFSDALLTTTKTVDPKTGKVITTKGQKPAKNLYLRYTFNKATITKMVNSQNKIEKTLVAKAKKIKDPVKRARYLHDWVARNVKYDYKASSALAWTTYAAAVKKSSRCLGYASLYRDLCNKAGLKTSVVVGKNSAKGKAGEHAWNKIIIKGKTYYVDTCWDASKAKKAKQTYFMKTASWMKKHKHIL